MTEADSEISEMPDQARDWSSGAAQYHLLQNTANCEVSIICFNLLYIAYKH